MILFLVRGDKLVVEEEEDDLEPRLRWTSKQQIRRMKPIRMIILLIECSRDAIKGANSGSREEEMILALLKGELSRHFALEVMKDTRNGAGNRKGSSCSFRCPFPQNDYYSYSEYALMNVLLQSIFFYSTLPCFGICRVLRKLQRCAPHTT